MCGEQKSSIKCLPWFLSILFFETESLKEPRAQQLSGLASQQAPEPASVCPSFPSTGVTDNKLRVSAFTVVLTDGESSPAQGDSFLKCLKDP